MSSGKMLWAKHLSLFLRSSSSPGRAPTSACDHDQPLLQPCSFEKTGICASYVLGLRNQLLLASLRMRLFKEWDFPCEDPDSARSFRPRLRALHHANLVWVGQNEISHLPVETLNTDSSEKPGALSFPFMVCLWVVAVFSSFKTRVYTSELWR